MKLPVALLFLVWGCSVAVAEPPKPKGDKPSLDLARAAIAKKPCKALEIVEPIKVKRAFYWKDGGSLGLELEDAKGTIHRFALDGREKGGPRHLFLGVTYPSEKAGKRVGIWGVEEQELYAVLLRWVNRHPQRSAILDNSRELDESKERLSEFVAFFARIDARFRQMNDLPPRVR
jgi:hypothetical protein